jgi:hypothetical protein
MIHGSVLETRTVQHVGILQAVLYGLPEPDKVSFMKGVPLEGGMLHKVLYGAKEVGAAGNKVGDKAL